MKKSILFPVMVLFLLGPFLGACAKNEADSKKSTIEEFTEKTGKSAAESIQRPLDKARALQKESAEKAEEMSDRFLENE